MLSKISLRWRLLGAGLVCALLTGLAGGGGIFSLRTVKNRMQETTTQVVQTIDDQNSLVNQLIELRSVVAEASNASSLATLSLQTAALDSINRLWDFDTDTERKAVLQAADDLIRYQVDLLTAQAELDSLRRSTTAVLMKISGLAQEIADDYLFDMVMAMDESTPEAKQDSYPLDTALLVWKLADNCHQLMALLNESLLDSDPYLVIYKGKKCQSQLDDVSAGLVRLPKDNSTGAIAFLIPNLHGLLMFTNDAKREALYAQMNLTRAHGRVNEAINGLDSSMVRYSAATKSDAEATMRSVSSLARHWQNIELLLVVFAFIMPIGIGIVLARSVTNQLQDLNRGINLVTDGKLDFKLDTGTVDEIGQLSRAFDGMTEQLSIRGKTIQESEKRFRGLFEQSNDGVLILRPDGQILDANLRICQIVGFSRKDLLAMNVRELHLPEDLNTSPITTRELTEYQSGHNECRYRTADGSVIHVEISASITDPEMGFAQAVIRDISDRKLAEIELQKHLEEISQGKQRLETLMSNTAEREIRMIQLKQEVNDLLGAAGISARYEAPAKVAELDQSYQSVTTPESGVESCL